MKLLHPRACGLLLALLLTPVLAFAQPTDGNTLPRGIYEPSGRQQIQTMPFALISKDSVSGAWCIAGSSSTCQSPAASEAKLQELVDAFELFAAQMAAPVASSDTSLGIAHVTSPSAEACRVFKSAAGNLYSAAGNVNVADTWIMVFNTTSVPADGAVTPYFQFKVTAAGPWSLDYGVLPAAFSTGITICASSTGPFTKTAYSTNNVLSARVK